MADSRYLCGTPRNNAIAVGIAAMIPWIAYHFTYHCHEAILIAITFTHTLALVGTTLQQKFLTWPLIALLFVQAGAFTVSGTVSLMLTYLYACDSLRVWVCSFFSDSSCTYGLRSSQADRAHILTYAVFGIASAIYAVLAKSAAKAFTELHDIPVNKGGFKIVPSQRATNTQAEYDHRLSQAYFNAAILCIIMILNWIIFFKQHNVGILGPYIVMIHASALFGVAWKTDFFNAIVVPLVRSEFVVFLAGGISSLVLLLGCAIDAQADNIVWLVKLFSRDAPDHLGPFMATSSDVPKYAIMMLICFVYATEAYFLASAFKTIDKDFDRKRKLKLESLLPTVIKASKAKISDI